MFLISILFFAAPSAWGWAQSSPLTSTNNEHLSQQTRQEILKLSNYMARHRTNFTEMEERVSQTADHLKNALNQCLKEKKSLQTQSRRQTKL